MFKCTFCGGEWGTKGLSVVLTTCNYCKAKYDKVNAVLKVEDEKKD